MKRIVIKKDEFVDVLHGTSIALGFVAGLGAVLRWVPSPYVGVAAIATSAAGVVKLYVDSTQKNLEERKSEY
jgi:hypothetical protein